MATSFRTLRVENGKLLEEGGGDHWREQPASELMERAAHLVDQGWEVVAIDNGIWYLQINLDVPTARLNARGLEE